MPENNQSPDNENWFTRNTGPLLAIITVLMTFFMFGYFVCLANSPSKESTDLRKAQHALTQAEAKFSDISSSKSEGLKTGKKEEVRKERDRSRKRVITAKEVAEDARDRRGVVKEFIMYILGVLSSALTTILGFYFGSSKSSADKNNALNVLAAKSQAPLAPAQVTPDAGVADKAKSTPQGAAG